MSLKSKITWESPQKLFPPGSRIATGVARRCILREDLYLEYAGLVADDLADTYTETETLRSFGLDDNGSAYRRLYFFRGSLRTLVEVQETIQGLNSMQEFRDMLSERLWCKFLLLKYLADCGLGRLAQ
jgi:hypothetical protein